MIKVVIVGTGTRCYDMFSKPIFEEFKNEVEICGLFDINKKRAEVISKYCGNPKVFDSFNTMLDEVKPDYVIVATIDSKHHEYIIASLNKGYNVISEKPMTIDEEKSNAIIDAEKKSGKKVIVTFNCRFMPLYSEIKKILNAGTIGKITHIDYQYMLNLSHGSDYFRRWHSRIENSGSLLVHKSTHHFDIINWFLNDIPEEVFAFGTQNLYAKNGKIRGERCLTCPHKNECGFYLDFNSLPPVSKELYLDSESEDGYFRDRCVFDESIDIFDTMSVNVKYKNGAFLQYALTTYSPYEGWKMIINGLNGRIEASELNINEDFDTIKVFDLKGNITEHTVKKANLLHNGGDAVLRKAIFSKDYVDDLGRMANSVDGANSLIIGASALKSIKEKRNIKIK